MRRPGRKTIARRVERLDARPCLSPEEEAALLDYLMHEEEEPTVKVDFSKGFELIEVEPPRGVGLSEALYRTAEEMRRAGVLGRVLGNARGLPAKKNGGRR